METALYINPNETLGKGNETYRILETVPFLIDQLSEIQRAQERVWIQSMAVEPGHFTDLLAYNLVAAHYRGVDVRFVRDSYSDYVTANSFNHLPFLLRKEDREYKDIILKRKADLIESLENHLQVRQTNIPTGILCVTPLPGVLGRDHKKISIIDNIVYLGGANLTPLDATRLDFMLKTNNKDIVSVLSSIFHQSFADIPVSDSFIRCDDNNAVLVDSGKRSQSIIMQYACDLVNDENESITLISPYLPLGNLRTALNKAVKRGVRVEVLTSEESQLGFAPKLSQFVHNAGQIKPLFSVTRYPTTVHAKALLLGNHSAMIGSHNFDELFVRFGTEEVALLTTQPEIIIQLNELRRGMKHAQSSYGSIEN